MKLTAELSLYPVQDDYIPVIQSFIDSVREHDDLQVVTNAMSTQICGDYDRVFAVVSAALASSTRQFGKQVLVVKFIPWELKLTP
ncbi:MAG: thiamine-binding protein [Pseudomonadales bacterium]|nr:thiamine-binding protein [Halioglobus sp.]MCP5131442.1 thiamine-binding protein [Pseudomonadales bacterium]